MTRHEIIVIKRLPLIENKMQNSNNRITNKFDNNLSLKDLVEKRKGIDTAM
jgi:hypothetical protein